MYILLSVVVVPNTESFVDVVAFAVSLNTTVGLLAEVSTKIA